MEEYIKSFKATLAWGIGLLTGHDVFAEAVAACEAKDAETDTQE